MVSIWKKKFNLKDSSANKATVKIVSFSCNHCLKKKIYLIVLNCAMKNQFYSWFLVHKAITCSPYFTNISLPDEPFKLKYHLAGIIMTNRKGIPTRISRPTFISWKIIAVKQSNKIFLENKEKSRNNAKNVCKRRHHILKQSDEGWSSYHKR